MEGTHPPKIINSRIRELNKDEMLPMVAKLYVIFIKKIYGKGEKQKKNMDRQTDKISIVQ